jgi:glycosyltransferase involved in cell wall biosynthesis
MLASQAYRDHKLAPLILSVWGNDFTMHARSNFWMGRLTGDSLRLADGLHTDCQRDLRLARQLGFSGQKPAVVLPGNGGVQTEIFYSPEDLESRRDDLVINPRGFRAYVRNDTFFRAVPIVLASRPNIRFVCPAMESEPEAVRWLNELKISPAVDLLPKLSRQEMAELFRKAQISVSPTTHDGTPNTLLEAMACGSFPVVGDLESIREWITPGENGLLVDSSNPDSLAEAILTALDRPDLRRNAAQINRTLVQERAEYNTVMKEALRFYRSVNL